MIYLWIVFVSLGSHDSIKPTIPAVGLFRIVRITPDIGEPHATRKFSENNFEQAIADTFKKIFLYF